MKKVKINENDLIINEDFSIFVNLDRVFVDEPNEVRDIEIEFVKGSNKYKFINFDGYYFIIKKGFKEVVANSELKKMRKYNKIYNVIIRL